MPDFSYFFSAPRKKPAQWRASRGARILPHPSGVPAAKLRRRVWFPTVPLSALRRLLARPPVNAGLLLLLLCAMQKARSVAGFAWREDFAAPLRGSPRQSFALPVSLLPLLPTARAMLARPPVNAGLLLLLLCAMQKARSVAGFAWRREEDSNLRTSHPRHTISNRAP